MLSAFKYNQNIEWEIQIFLETNFNFSYKMEGKLSKINIDKKRTFTS